VNDPNNRLILLPDHQIGVSLVDPISQRLDGLVRIAEQEGNHTTRKEVVSALVLAAPTDYQAIDELLATFRRGRVSDAVRGIDENPNVERRPGPRPRRRRRSSSGRSE
jgi:hypothetical protein